MKMNTNYKKKICILNNISGILFLVSTLSLSGIYYINNDTYNIAARVMGIIFWICFITGLVLQLLIYKTSKYVKLRHSVVHWIFLIIAGVCLTVLFAVNILSEDKPLCNMLLLMGTSLSIGMFFYLRWRLNL